MQPLASSSLRPSASLPQHDRLSDTNSAGKRASYMGDSGFAHGQPQAPIQRGAAGALPITRARHEQQQAPQVLQGASTLQGGVETVWQQQRSRG